MITRDQSLYSQIHPAKLSTDVLASIVSLYFFWQHATVVALTVHLLPSIIASLLVIILSDLQKQERSSFGRYVKRHMSRAMEVVRLAGDIIMVLGAFYHLWVVIAFGFLIVLAAWMKGWVVTLLTNRE